MPPVPDRRLEAGHLHDPNARSRHDGWPSVAARALIVAVDIALRLVEVRSDLGALGADEDRPVITGDAVALHQLAHSTLPQLVSD